MTPMGGEDDVLEGGDRFECLPPGPSGKPADASSPASDEARQGPECSPDTSKNVNTSVATLAERIQEVNVAIGREQKPNNHAPQAFLQKRQARIDEQNAKSAGTQSGQAARDPDSASLSNLAPLPGKPQSPENDGLRFLRGGHGSVFFGGSTRNPFTPQDQGGGWYSEDNKRERGTRSCAPKGPREGLHLPRSVMAADFLKAEDEKYNGSTGAHFCSTGRRLELAANAEAYPPSTAEHSAACLYKMDHASADVKAHGFFVQRRRELAGSELAAYAGNPKALDQVRDALESEARTAKAHLESQAHVAERELSAQQLGQAVQNRARVGQHQPRPRAGASGCKNREEDEARADRKKARGAAVRQASVERKERLRANRPSQTAPQSDQRARNNQGRPVGSFQRTAPESVVSFAPGHSGSFRRRVKSPAGTHVVLGGAHR